MWRSARRCAGCSMPYADDLAVAAGPAERGRTRCVRIRTPSRSTSRPAAPDDDFGLRFRSPISADPWGSMCLPAAFGFERVGRSAASRQLSRADVPRNQGRPAAPISVAPARALSAESFPPAVLDLDSRRIVTGGDEPDLDLRRVRAIAPEVPQVAEPSRWLPDRDLAPLVLDAGRGPFEDPATGPPLQHHREI